MNTTDNTFLGWHQAGPAPDGEPVLIATLRSPNRQRGRGCVIQVYSDGGLAYQFGGNPKWVRSRLSVYRKAAGLIGGGDNLTPEEFVEGHVALGYQRVEVKL